MKIDESSVNSFTLHFNTSVKSLMKTRMKGGLKKKPEGILALIAPHSDFYHSNSTLLSVGKKALHK